MNEEPELDAELGFEPSASATGADPASPADSTRRARTPRAGRTAKPRRSPLRRRLAAGGALVGALGVMGGVYAAFASSSGAADDVDNAQQIAVGHTLYETSCITCHGANLQGVENRGVSLIGVGGAATYFQVSTGRMPATGQGSEEYRKTAKFTEAQTEAIAAYIQSVGGGPALPKGNLEGNAASIATGGELFRLNCASCHGTTFKGAPLSAGKTAPSLNAATTKQIYAAMLSGPESMPIFSNNELTVAQKKAIVAYIQTIKASNDPGGSGIGRIGPVSEGIVIWVAGIGVLLVAILWIGAKSQ